MSIVWRLHRYDFTPNHDFKTNLGYSFGDAFGLKKFATLLPNNWLVETPQALALMTLGRHSAEREPISEIDCNFF
ncbi:hypothetical protein ACPOM7_23235 [Peribacillus castrilensis]|uniref:hypothetical protein n=1 Tax=Bacillaceae TaxID=186817 RepID=UPI00115B7703|nr:MULTISPECIES: hypothetical protein [Bacillaceae]MCP1093879.1 hypothetical protein [Bacillaceae bacterium OS4b]MBD8586851.1 hypothetical protein [Peribacillus simplex]MCF7621037.1 hypothetical protein [Peribacillus frigoritolerans]MCT1386900.1 hypothetical protein [Peribacillus frigoritolerans]MEA3574422.1 hypothetical protein [Peribacillus frigoritolerans]